MTPTTRADPTMRILITGASGQLGAYLIAEARAVGHEPIAWSGRATGERSGVSLRPIDLTDRREVDRALGLAEPDLIIHAAAISSADAVRLDPAASWRINVDATAHLAAWADEHERGLIFTSTDLVFDGSKPWNREDDPARPLLGYGRSKLNAEGALGRSGSGLVARLPLLFGPSRSGRLDFFAKAVEAIRGGQPRAFFADEFRTPLDFATAARLLIRLGEVGASGLIHVAGAERVSRFDLMRRAAGALGLDPTLVRESRLADADLAEPRPVDVSLGTERLAAILRDAARPSIEEALRDLSGPASRR